MSNKNRTPRVARHPAPGKDVSGAAIAAATTDEPVQETTAAVADAPETTEQVFPDAPQPEAPDAAHTSAEPDGEGENDGDEPDASDVDGTKRIMSLAHLGGLSVKSEDGPFTFVVDGNLPRFAASPNLTAILLSRATGAPVKVVGADGKVHAVADFETLDAMAREAKLLRSNAFGGNRSGGRKAGATLTAQEEKVRDLAKRPEGASRKEIVEALGKAGNAFGVIKRIATHDNLLHARDKNQDPPRFWLYAPTETSPLVKAAQAQAMRIATARKTAR